MYNIHAGILLCAYMYDSVNKCYFICARLSAGIIYIIRV